MSKEIIVKNQKELDVLPIKFEEFTIIKIIATETILIKTACGNATVEACDNATVEACGNATVRAYDNATVRAYDNATVRAYGNATVRAYDNATVRAYDNATVEACGNATVRACGNATVRAYGNATVEACGNATVEAYGNATVRAYDNATVRAYDNATVEAYELAVIIVFACLSLKLYQMSSAFLRGLKKKDIRTFQKSKTSNLILQPRIFEHNLKSYLEINKPDKKGFLTLYKSVRPDNNKDFFSNSVEYKIGETIICPDWIDNNSIQCGNGLHLCKTPLDSLLYNNGKLLKCEANIKDINIYASDISKIRCKKVKVICEVNKRGEEIK